MLKWLLIFGGVSALFVTIALVACQYERTREDKERASTELARPTSVPQSQGCQTHNQSCDCTPKTPCWYVLVAWPDGITAWAIILTFAVIGWQADQTRESAAAAKDGVRIARETLIQTQRPRINVRTFYFSDPRSNFEQVPSRILFQEMLTGQFYIVNLGGTRATVKETLYEFYISKSLKLPAKRPWEGKDGVKCHMVLEAGQSKPHTFGRFEPVSSDEAYLLSIKKTYLFLMGWVDYVDDLGIRRTTRFCRLYDADSERFRAIDDAEYESAD